MSNLTFIIEFELMCKKVIVKKIIALCGYNYCCHVILYMLMYEWIMQGSLVKVFWLSKISHFHSIYTVNKIFWNKKVVLNLVIFFRSSVV
jgi:hypothetical protein